MTSVKKRRRAGSRGGAQRFGALFAWRLGCSYPADGGWRYRRSWFSYHGGPTVRACAHAHVVYTLPRLDALSYSVSFRYTVRVGPRGSRVSVRYRTGKRYRGDKARS